MPVNSKEKGKRGELEACHLLQSLGFDAQRTVQYSGADGTADIICKQMPNVHFEVKYGVQGMDIGTLKLLRACRQAHKYKTHRRPVVLWKPYGSSKWRVTTLMIPGSAPGMGAAWSRPYWATLADEDAIDFLLALGGKSERPGEI